MKENCPVCDKPYGNQHHEGWERDILCEARCRHCNTRMIEYINGEYETWFFTKPKDKKPYPFAQTKGEFKYYYANGKLKKKGEVHDSSVEGKVELYYEDGALQGTINYTRGMEHGECYIYYRNGKLKERMRYLSGIKIGPFEKFDIDGKCTMKGENLPDGTQMIHRGKKKTFKVSEPLRELRRKR